MKSKVRSTLLFVVLFVLAVSSLFADPPEFTPDNITAVPASGNLGITSSITITVVDVNNITVPAKQFVSAKVDLSQLGGPTDQAMVKVSNAPGHGQWRATYVVTLGNIDGVSNRTFSVTAINADGTHTEQYAQTYTVDNVPSMNNADFTGNPYLRINSSNAIELMKVDDSVTLIANFRPYIERVWVNWGATFLGAPEIEYTLSNGVLNATYTPASGTLPSPYIDDLSITISKMKSISNNGMGPYFSNPAWNRVVSKNLAGFPIAADLNPPSMIGAWDLFYDVSALTYPSLRFSPQSTTIDGYTTLPNTFNIYVKLPGWGTLGGPTQFTIEFRSENRFPTFQKTFSILDSPATVTHLGGGLLEVTWDGKDGSGQLIGPLLETTVGLTLVEVKDYVGNPAQLSRDPDHVGLEFPEDGDITDPDDHYLIYHGGLPHVGYTVQNRIHVIVDNANPAYEIQPELTNPNNASVTRLINDQNNNGTWDSGEQVYYNNSAGYGISSVVDFKFQTRRNFTADENTLRYENQYYWLIVEKEGANPAERWYWTGFSWAPLSLFNQNTDAIQVPFSSNPGGGGSGMSDVVVIPWDLGTLPSTIFTGATDTGTTYVVTGYLQDNAGNVVRSNQALEITISSIYMNIPFVQDVNIVSEHTTTVGGLPVTTGGVKNFYLDANYSDDPTYSGPLTGQYYETTDAITIEVQVNNREYLRPTNSVELRFDQLGVPNPQIKYLNRNQFGVDNKATITISADDIPISKGSLTPGQMWEVGGANGVANYIQVISHAIDYIVNGTTLSQSFDALDSDLFNLVIPPAPDYPDPNWSVYQLAVTEPSFSPGNPLNTYDAITNPANDELKDNTDFSFTIPNGSNISWRLEVSNNNTLVRHWSGHLGVGDTPYISGPITFNGLDETLHPVVDALATQALTTTLYIEPDPMGDPGYLPPPAGINPYIGFKVDNTNPALVSNVVSGTGTSISAQRKITLLNNNVEDIKVVTQTQNTLSFTVRSSEALTNAIGAPHGWQVLVRDMNNNPIINNTDPLNPLTVGATVTEVIPSADNMNFNITVTLSNLDGTVTHQNAILILRLPWDDASNPGRFNDPAYPYNADVWHYDSSEYYLTFNILDAKPRIEWIKFAHRGVEGEANYSSGIWNPANPQAWVGPWIASPSTADDFVLTARVSGGAYRSMHTDWTANLQPILGGTGSTNTAVEPVAVPDPNPINPNEARMWTLTWSGNIPQAVANNFSNGATLQIPITVITRDDGNPIAHQEIKTINIKVDKAAPTVSNTQTAIVANGNSQNYSLAVNDTNGSGVYWDTIPNVPSYIVPDNLVLTPYPTPVAPDGITQVSTGNGTYGLTMPNNTAIKYFQAQYVVMDRMGNQTIYNRYLNVDPLPILSNVKINNNTGWFVPGTSLTVTWELTNAQRATGGLLTLSAPGVTLSSYDRNLTAAQLQAGTYTYPDFYLNNTALDGKTLTATVTGWTTGYANATNATTSNRNFTYNQNTDTIQIDTKPLITSVSFKLNGTVINTLAPNTSRLTVEAVVTSSNPLDPAQTTIGMVAPSGSTLSGVFDFGGANPTITTNGNTKTIVWTGVSVSNLLWEPLTDLGVARFNVDTKTIYGYAATRYMHDMALMKAPFALIQGKTGRDAYAGVDPDGWFAPEHFLHTEYTFISNVDVAGTPIIPPVTADFDLIEDNISDNWREVNSPSTKTTVSKSLVRGTATTATINVNAYKYMAKWVIAPDVQSIWNAYDDGAAIDIDFKYRQYSFVTNPVLDDDKFIKVDKNVPEYDDYLEIATGTATAPGSWQLLQNGFPGQNPPISVALDPTTQKWPANTYLYLKYKAIDGNGAGARHMIDPSTLQQWTITQHSQTTNAGVLEKIIKMYPLNINNVDNTSVLTLTMGTVQDSVGHINYGGPTNSTDPNWTATSPTVSFNFRSDYATSHAYLHAFKYLSPNRMDSTTSPYVQAGEEIGVLLKLNPVVPDRGTDVQYIEVSSVQLNTKYITNVTGGVDNWVTMAKDPITEEYYLNADYAVNPNYAHGAGISMQYRINYTIHYTNGDTSVPPAFVSAVYPNVGIVDKEAPQFIFDGTSTNPLNQRSLFFWSGSIGPTEEGYVVPGDNDGEIHLIFKDSSGYTNTNTKPVVTFTNLDEFVTGMPQNYSVPSNLITHYPTYSISVDNNTYNYTDVWVASLENLSIYAQVPPIYSTTIGYTVYDVVGNGPAAGDRYVEIAADGPMVPIIRHIELVSTVPGTNGQVYNYLAEGVPATMKVYIHTQHSAFIENVYIDPITGVAYGADTTPQAIDINDPLNHNANWLVTIPVTPNNVNNYDNINFVVHTIRHPYGAAMFTGTKELAVVVDGKDFAMDEPTVTGFADWGYWQENIYGMLGPRAYATITVQFHNIGELIVENGITSLPDGIENWFSIQNLTPAAFLNIPSPDITINGADVFATWRFEPWDINQDIAQTISELGYLVTYQDIWGHIDYRWGTFDFDQKAPVISTGGITFAIADTTIQTENFTANPNAPISNTTDWTKVRFALNDPLLRANVPGSGIHYIHVEFTREPETYIPSPDPLANMTPTYNPDGYVELAFNPGFSAFDLAEGYYNFTIYTSDRLANEAFYTQRFHYRHQPSQMEIEPPNGSTITVLDDDGNITQQQIIAFPYDPTGQVQGVQFFLYEDTNDNGTYEAGTDIDRTAYLTNDANNSSVIDWVAPYTVMWDLNKPAFKYLVNAQYGRANTRKFLIRASALSEGVRAVSDSIIVINVHDNQPPIPEVPTYSGNTTFNYLDTDANVINLSTGFAPEWIDAEWAIFEIFNGETLITSINALYNAGVADTTWNYSGLVPGDYIIKVKGRDFVGNTSAGVAMAAPITINNPASLITYDLSMVNVLGFNNEPQIPNNEIYGFNNPASAVGNLRLDADFYIDGTNPQVPSLEGIASITFKARVTNNITGVVTTVEVPNDTDLQPDYPASGPIAVTSQMHNNTVSIFVPDGFYMPAGYDANDFTYEFYIELTPTHPAELIAPVYQNIRLDYFAPRVAITENTPNITWSRNNHFKVTGDIADIDTLVLKWSSDNTTYHDAVYGNLAYNLQPNTTHYAQFENWNTAGGSLETLLDYTGAAWLKVVATDGLGNVRESAAVQVFVDNEAPHTPVTHVAYRSHPDIEGENGTAYAALHTLGSLNGETDNTITVVTSTQDYGSSALRIYVDPTQISNLSNVALDDPNFNTHASWYTGTTDFRPPVRLYHGFSATGDVNNITWSNDVYYDHEPLNGLYGFDVPSTQIQVSGTHYFILGVNDTRGNVEGDDANNGTPAAIAFDGTLSAAEKQAAIDLIVNVINVADVKVEIVSHNDNDIVGEWINLAADITENIGNVNVNQVRFEYKVNNTWTEIATVTAAPASNVKFHLYRKDIPAYDGLPFVPGVHLYNADTNTLISEMIWDDNHACWEYTANLAQGNYNFEYRLDLNNDGIISGLDLDVANQLGTVYIIQDPNGFTSFNVTPWVIPLNTETIEPGIYEFRALPLAANGGVLFNQVAPSRWILIDNDAPATTITVRSNVQRIRPDVDPVTILADVNELLVAVDDIVEVVYQYASQPAVAPVRRWVEIATQTNMGGNYQQQWTAPAPLTDLVDNDNDGLVDEADEADAWYYLRAVANDKAGNYYTSNIYTIFVDGSAPQMLVDHINGVLVDATNNIFEIPNSGPVRVLATNITPDIFDDPVMVSFEYSYKSSVDLGWSGWQKFDAQNPWIEVEADTVSAVLPFVSEGYYKFRAISQDELGNTDAQAPETYVVFNDVDGSNAKITMVGSRDVISEQYTFSDDREDFNNTIQATIDFPEEINTVTFEWRSTESDPWTNVWTMATDQIATTVTAPWTVPNFGADNFGFLRIVAQDMYGNNESEQIVKLFLDNSAPGVVVNSLTHNVADGLKWLDNTEAVALNISYTNLPEDGLVDVASATVKIINTVTGVTIAETYTNVNQASVSFTFTADQMANLTDGIYRLEIVLTDFAGNTATILPDDYQTLYIDTAAPAGLAMVSTSHPNNIAVYNVDAIDFQIDYTDLIGVAPTGGMTATFTYQNVSQTVSEYTLDTVNNTIAFTWNPSQEFEDFIMNGEMNILVSADVKVYDLLNHESTVPNTNDFFTLTYGIPGVTRLMAVTDVVNGNQTTHFVNWNMPTPQVVELVGTNHTGIAQPLGLYAYVPSLSEIPTNVVFSYRLLGDANWTPIATVPIGQGWDFIDTSFHDQYSTQYSTTWDIAALDGGDYEVQVTSNFDAGSSSSVALVHIYNGTIVPQVAVPTMVNGTVQRGETYAVTAPSFIGAVEYLSQVSYQYRYVNVENNVVSPVSQWMYFGDQNGQEPADPWISEPYSFDWTVYPYYLYNNTIQIVAFAKDQWGTETPITSILGANAYTLATIVDTEAPDATISYTWNGLNDPEWVSGAVSPNMTINADITSDMMLSDLARVDFMFNSVVIGTDNVAPFSFAWTGLPADPAITSGILQVVTYDIYGNMNANPPITLNIDNTLPTANFVLPANVDRGTALVLNANAADAPAGVLNVEYVYAKTTVPAQPWIAIDTVVAAPWTYEWTVPADLEFGANYTVQATITDQVGLVTTVTSNFTVTDPDTPMQILTVAGYAPVNNIIPVRLHDDVSIETAVNDVNIMRVEYVIRNSDTAPWTHLEYAEVVAGRADIVLSDILTGFAEGDYTLAVRAREARETIGNIATSVEVTLDHSMAIGQAVTEPANDGFFNGETFTVNFTVTTDDEIDNSSIALEYRVIGIDGADDWHAPVIGNSTVVRTGVNTYLATFTDVEVYQTPTSLLNGMLDFRFSVSDQAEETPNIGTLAITNVMYDTTDPEVIFTDITGDGVTQIAGIYNIPMATVATVNGNVWDVLYGQTNQVASGIDKVELWYNYNNADVLIGTDTEAPYSFTWNTTGLAVGTYTLGMMAYDHAGNVNGATQIVSIVPAAGWEPYALITAMSFDGDTANQDMIYAEVDSWNNEAIDQVAFEFLAGTTWTQFAAISAPATTQIAVPFNAEPMTNATKIRTVVTYNGGLISTSMPTLDVAHSEANGGSLTVVQPTINANVFYNDELRITGQTSAPRVTTLYNNTMMNTLPVQMVDGVQTAFFDVPLHGEYQFWAAAINYTNWTMQLNSTILNTYNIGSPAHNGISTTVPANSFVYFENVDTVALPDGFTGLSAQNAVIATPQSDLVYNVTLTGTPAPNGTVVGMYYDGIQWINVPATISGNIATFTAPSGFIYAVGQYTGTDFNVVFSSIDPQHAVGNVLWTVEAPTSIKFFVYDGFTQGGYTSPAPGTITWQLYVDDAAVPSTYDNGFITATTVTDLAAGAHTASVVVTMNGVEVTAEKAFNVDTTQPVIVATGTQLTVSNRTISATITDPETGIMAAHLLVVNTDDPALNMTVPLQIPATGNTYSYTFTMDDLNALGYDVNYTMPLNVIWFAANPLLPEVASQPINYTVNIEGPAIEFTGFANGWWINPTFTTPLTFTVTVPQGRTMPTDGVSILLEEVTPLGNTDIQTMTLTWDTVAGNVYNYSLNFGQLLSPAATAVKLNVFAIDNYNISNQSEQTYGIDMAAPVLWAMTPVGDPIDNDGDGLFNEDVPNGVNEDLDWVDADQDGVWDIGEAQIIDEDPIDFLDAVIPQGTSVVIALGFDDYSGFQYLLPGGTTWFYTGQSGIDTAEIHVSMNGTAITGTITNNTFTYNAGVLESNHYTVVATVPDVVGNVGSLAFEFDVVGGAPTITFNPLTGGGWWINSTEEPYELTFTVQSEVPLATGGVIANLYAEPANTLIQGPITPTPNQGVYTITLLGGVVPADQTGIRLEVTATDIWGMTSTSNQTYGIDNNAPVITIHTPVEGTEVTIGATVNITATVSDQTPVRVALSNANNGSKERTGSGLSVVSMTVTNPAGTPQVFNDLTGAIAETITASMYGDYQVSIFAKDVAGNESVGSTNFTVLAPAPEITFIAPTVGWWLNSTEENTLGFTVSSDGIDLAVGGVIANVYTIPSNTLLQGPVTPSPVSGVYNVSVMGGVIPADQTGIRMEVSATNVLGGTSISNQLYGIDNIAPAISLISPAEDAQYNLHATVNIAATISDVIATRLGTMLSTSNGTKDRAAGSGIQNVTLTVIAPDGTNAFEPESYPANTQVISKPMVATQYGTYIINLLAKDFAGNQSMVTRNFIVTPTSAPVVTFTDIAWLNSVGMNNLNFAVSSVVPVNVTANVIAYPSEALLMGPLSVNPVDGVYTVALNGAMIPADQTAVRLQVIATDQFNNVTEANHYYSVDRIAPEIIILNPVNGAEVTLVDETTKVRIDAQFSDLAQTLKIKTKGNAGSGIAGSRMIVTDPMGMQVGDPITTGMGITESTLELSNLMLGTYTVRVTAWDVAGNQAVASVNFIMIATPLPPEPPVELEITTAMVYPNPMLADGTGRIRLNLSTDADVNIRIYDFAGREVRSLDYSGKVMGKAMVDIAFDGCNDQGVKLARGTYFARVIANDGKKIVEKVVKIAIKK